MNETSITREDFKHVLKDILSDSIKLSNFTFSIMEQIGTNEEGNIEREEIVKMLEQFSKDCCLKPPTKEEIDSTMLQLSGNYEVFGGENSDSEIPSQITMEDVYTLVQIILEKQLEKLSKDQNQKQ